MKKMRERDERKAKATLCANYLNLSGTTNNDKVKSYVALFFAVEFLE